MQTLNGPNKEATLCITQVAQDEAVLVAHQVMNLKLITGPMAQALGDLLLYCDQHNPDYLSTTRLYLAWIQKNPVPFHPGSSNTTLVAEKPVALTKEILSPARIGKT